MEEIRSENVERTTRQIYGCIEQCEPSHVHTRANQYIPEPPSQWPGERSEPNQCPCSLIRISPVGRNVFKQDPTGYRAEAEASLAMRVTDGNQLCVEHVVPKVVGLFQTIETML
jgi:hypothetical protein